MIDTGDLHRGISLEMDGVLYQLLDYQHLKLGRGSAQVRLKLRDIRGGHIIERTVQAGSKFTLARVERQNAQYLYREDDVHYFMNTETYDQILINSDRLGEALRYLKENAICQILTYGEEAIGVELPASVELAVAETEPGIRGDTAQGGNKPARLETGLLVQVPLHVSIGDVVKVDTRSGEYLGKA